MSISKFRLFNILYFILLFFILQLLLVSCSGPKMFVVPVGPPYDKNTVPKPESREINTYAEYFEKQLILQLDESTDLSRQIRNMTGNQKQALNYDAFGEVPNSSWFTNRNGKLALTLEEIAAGPNKSTGPNTSDTWIITRAKAQGVTPGFSIKDINGENYVIKFDPPGYGELASGAEVVSTKLFYAAGYNTPENYIVYFDPKILKMGEKVRFTDLKGRKRFMNELDLKKILERVELDDNGKIRALASKYIAGSILGPFKYKGVRNDDYNDIIPHQHRRELRGLRLIAAWLNHFDTKDGNSLDAFVTENEKSFVKHYLIDFGATLGSASHGPNPTWRGYEYDYDPKAMLTNVATVGLYIKPWEKQDGVLFHSIGYYESRSFHPLTYKPQMPNPAFENMTEADAYWVTRIIMSFSNEQIETAVKQGQYSNPEAAQYLTKTLIERRDKIGKYIFNIVNPLDDFELRKNGDGLQTLAFENYAEKFSFVNKGETEYICQGKIITEKNEKLMFETNSRQQHITIPQMKKEDVPFNDNWQIKVSIKLKRDNLNKLSKAINIYLLPTELENECTLLGIKRGN